MTDRPDRRELTDELVTTAEGLGFARVGIVSAKQPARYSQLLTWLEHDYHGEMRYMAEDAQVRARGDLERVLAGTRSAVVVLASYDHRQPEQDPNRGRVARYAHGADYHQVMRRALEELAESIRRTGAQTRACVDTAPILERDLAERAGLGFIGKNTMLIAPGIGSYTFIGVLLTTADLTPTPVAELGDRCGSCTACLDACPTQAFAEPYVLDARRCISYLTIEHRSSIASELRPAMSTMVYGCDICQEVCPYNARAPERQVAFPGLGGDDSPRRAPALAELIELRAGGYRRLTRGSAMNRARRRMLKRNAIIAAGNSGIAEAELSRALADDDPGIREAAAWALAELGATSVLRARLAEEDDRSVRAAITTLLSRPSDRERER